MAKENNPATEVQIFQITCTGEEIRNEVVERCEKQEGSRILFRGRDDEGNFVVIHAITGPAITRPAAEYHGRWAFPYLESDLVETYAVESSIKITGRR